MARAVGDSRTYPLSLLNSAGQPIGRTRELPSVTTILKALPKNLSWWGYKMGLLEGRKHAIVSPELVNLSDDDFYEELKRLAREEGSVQTPLNVMEAAGDRGTTVHDVAEQVFRDNVWPDKALIPEHLHGYVTALKRWYDARIDGKGFEVLAVEVNLASISKYPYIYAGTCDLILKDSTDTYHVIDFKTSKGIYESHLLQSTAYGYAAWEEGYIPEGALVMAHVVRFGADGKYATKTSECTIEDFIDVYKVYLWLQKMGARAS